MRLNEDRTYPLMKPGQRVRQLLLRPNERYKIHHGDCIPHLHEMPPESIDMCVYSPPFVSVFSYTELGEDIGNSENFKGDAKLHFSFFFNAIRKVIKPGRLMIVHCQQVRSRVASGGDGGLHDFRGLLIRLAVRAGFIYAYDWLIRKNPQAQAIRTRSRSLQFVGLESDRSKSAGAFGDYLLILKAPGENVVPIVGGVSREEWIAWAESAWFDIRETDTLNVKEGRGKDDTRHVCLAKDSLVLTKERGYVPIQGVLVGESALTHKGRWRRVLAVQNTGVQPTLQLSAQGVPDLILTPEHRVWLRKSEKERKRDGAAEAKATWIPASESLGGYVNLKLPPTEKASLADNQVWWIVGRWLADGHWDCRNSIHISCGDHKLKKLRERLGSYAGFTHYPGTCSQIRLKDAGGVLRKIISRCGSGASGKHIPPEAFTLPIEQARSLLEGYLSGDGHFLESRKRWMASSVSKSLLLGMSVLVQRVHGAIASVYAGREERESEIEGRRVLCKQDWILSFDLPEGRRKSPFILKDGAWKRVRSIEDAGEIETWNLRVEEDESFTAEGCVVKNCPLQLGVIERIIRMYSNPGELVLDPFMGIGSTAFCALKLDRRAYGMELKTEYWKCALKNCERALKSMGFMRPHKFFDGNGQKRLNGETKIVRPRLRLEA